MKVRELLDKLVAENADLRRQLESQAIDPNSRENLCQENAMLRNDLELAKAALSTAKEEGRREMALGAAAQMDKCRLIAQESARAHTGELAGKYIAKAEALWAAREWLSSQAKGGA